MHAATEEIIGLRGQYRDVIRGTGGDVEWDSGWQSNAIVEDCRRLLAGFARGAPASLGIQGIAVGSGDPAWDAAPLPPDPTKTLPLVSPLSPIIGVAIDFLNPDGTVAPAGVTTNRIQVVANLGPGVPPGTPTLREFGLIGALSGAPILINYVMHSAIAKDPTSMLERTIWLVF